MLALDAMNENTDVYVAAYPKGVVVLAISVIWPQPRKEEFDEFMFMLQSIILRIEGQK